MRSETALAVLIASELALIVVGVAVGLALPPPREPAAVPPFAAVLWGMVALSTLLAWIGLLHHIREARTLYLASWLGYLALELVGEPRTGLDSALVMLSALVGGAILGLAYFSDLRDRLRPLRTARSSRRP